MGKGIFVIILVLFLVSLRLESKLIVSACEFVTKELGKPLRTRKITLRTWKMTLQTRKIPLITLASLHAATVSLDSSLKRAERNKTKMMTLPICNLFHLWLISLRSRCNFSFPLDITFYSLSKSI
jgi:hypothetical protein